MRTKGVSPEENLLKNLNIIEKNTTKIYEILNDATIDVITKFIKIKKCSSVITTQCINNINIIEKNSIKLR